MRIAAPLALACLVIPGALRHHVAPWDTPDAPNPDPGLPASASLVEAPVSMVEAQASRATLPNGITVELRSIARRPWRNPYGGPLPDARPVWSPDGAAYRGSGPERPTIEGVTYPHPTGGLLAREDDPRAFDDKGARYLTFHLTGPEGAELDVAGGIPETSRQGEPHPALHGRDVATQVLLRNGRADYETGIVVDDRAATHYRLAVASGEWKTVASVPLDLKDPTGITALAKGTWGTLVQDASNVDALRHAHGGSGPGPYVAYRIEAAEPRAFATRTRFVESGGKVDLASAIGLWGNLPIMRVEVQARPYAWAEFSNVHYDPDPAKWSEGYWGAEGKKAEVRREGSSLRAIVDSGVESNSTVVARVFAPDGRLWRNAPDLRPVFPEASPELHPGFPGARPERAPTGDLFADLRLGPQAEQNDGWTKVHAFASTSRYPGKGLGERLDKEGGGFRRPKTPYVQFQVNQPLPWRKIGEIPPLSAEEEARLKHFLAAAPNAERDKQGRVFDAVFVTAYAEGYAWLAARSGDPPPPATQVRWTVREPGTHARIVMRTRDGSRYPFGRAVAHVFYLQGDGPRFHPGPAGRSRLRGLGPGGATIGADPHARRGRLRGRDPRLRQAGLPRREGSTGASMTAHDGGGLQILLWPTRVGLSASAAPWVFDLEHDESARGTIDVGFQPLNVGNYPLSASPVAAGCSRACARAWRLPLGFAILGVPGRRHKCILRLRAGVVDETHSQSGKE